MFMPNDQQSKSYTRRGLHDKSNIQIDPSRVKGFEAFFPASKNPVVETSGKEADRSLYYDAPERNGISDEEAVEEPPEALLLYYPRRTYNDGDSQTSLENSFSGASKWDMWCMWSCKIDELLEGSCGRKIPMEKETFVDAMLGHAMEYFPSFPFSCTANDLKIVVVNDNCTQSGSDEVWIPVSEVSFRMSRKAETKTKRAKFILRCCGGLAEVFRHSVQVSEVLMIQGGVFVTETAATGNRVFLDLTERTWKRPIHILRTVQTGKEPTSAYFLGEYITPLYESSGFGSIPSRFQFTYLVAKVDGKGSIIVTRNRQCQPEHRITSSKSSVLDKYFFPLSRNETIEECIRTLLFYDWNKDVTWPQRFSTKRGASPRRVLRSIDTKAVASKRNNSSRRKHSAVTSKTLSRTKRIRITFVLTTFAVLALVYSYWVLCV